MEHSSTFTVDHRPYQHRWYRLVTMFKMEEDNRTVWCGNLSEKVTEEILYELFLQAGPLERVRIPKDRDGRQRSYGFVTFKHKCSAPYSIALFEGTSLFSKTLILQTRNGTDSGVYHGVNSRESERQRTKTLSVDLGHTMAAAAVEDYNKLLQLGQQMLIPGSLGLGSVSAQMSQYSAFLPSNNSPLYRSQMNNSYYFGGNLEKMPHNSRDNYGRNRNYPSSHGSHGVGSRGHERNHSSSSRHSNSYSSKLHQWSGGGRRRH